MRKRRIQHRKKKRSTEKLPHDKIEATHEPVPEPKTYTFEKVVESVLTITAWAVIWWRTALYASGYTSSLAAILIGLLVGTIAIGFLLLLGFEGLELSCFSLGFLVCALSILSMSTGTR